MTKPDAIDSASLPTGAECNAAGVELVAGYIGWQAWKCVTAAQIRDWHAHNVGFEALYEDGAQNALRGAPQGTTDGVRARTNYTNLQTQVGYAPANQTAIIMAVDFDTNPAEYPAIDAYLRACDAAITGHILGDYGEADLIDHEATIAAVGFGTYAWSNKRVSAHADLQQYLNGQTVGGHDADLDHIINAARLAAWWPPDHPLNVLSEGATPVTMSDAQLVADAAQGDRVNAASTEFHDRIVIAVNQSAVGTAVTAIAKAITTLGTVVAAIQTTLAKVVAAQTAQSAQIAALQAAALIGTSPVTVAVTAEQLADGLTAALPRVQLSVTPKAGA